MSDDMMRIRSFVWTWKISKCYDNSEGTVRLRVVMVYNGFIVTHDEDLPYEEAMNSVNIMREKYGTEQFIEPS